MNTLSIILCIIIVILIVYVILSYKEQSCKKCLENMISSITSEPNSHREPRNTVVG